VRDLGQIFRLEPPLADRARVDRSPIGVSAFCDAGPLATARELAAREERVVRDQALQFLEIAVELTENSSNKFRYPCVLT